ncbi:DUF3592 domain-containing protein [Stenotrophomonas maltophilia]|nr:DUF3592 domain-containing protein [Stenotrophomonas maltophilia]
MDFRPGAALLIAAGVIYQRDKAFAGAARSATGQMVEQVQSWSRDRDGRTSRGYASRVRFTVEGGRAVEFVETVFSYPPRHAEGEQVPVLYDSDRPSQAMIDDFRGRYTALAIVGALGTVFAMLGVPLVAVTIRSARRTARLLRTGRPIEAEFLHVFVDDSLEIDGKHPFRVAAQVSDQTTGKLRRFDSPPIWGDPTALLEGRKVTVLTDSADEDYLVDLSGVVDESAYA